MSKETRMSGVDHLPDELVLAAPVAISLPCGRDVSVSRATARFRMWPGPITIHTWGNKPVLDVNGEQTFAEVAILRAFQRAGWSAKWLEAYNAAKDWPIVLDRWHADGITSCEPVDLGSADVAQLLRSIIHANGGSCRGCWDVVAWKENRIVLAEAKRRSKDRINDNQRGFVEAALSIGVPPNAFLIVEWTAETSASEVRRGAAKSPMRAPTAPTPQQPTIARRGHEDSADDASLSTATGVHIFTSRVEWRAWYVAHPTGYFYNERRNTIHRVGCPHYKIDGDVEEYFKRPKPCHVSRSALGAWVLESRGAPAKRCSSCQ